MRLNKKILLALTGLMIVASASACSKSDISEDGTFTPSDTINWTVTSSPGGGSDIFTRKIGDIMTKEDMINGQTVIVTNKTDGGGEIGRNETATLKGSKANYTLLTFNSGDLMPMVENTKNRVANFKPIAILAVDKQLLFKGENTKYADFAEAIEAAKNGTEVVIGGSKGDDVATYEALLEELDIPSNVMKYITYNSSGDAITAALGGHVEFVISKPAAASEYVEAGSLIPVLALATERYTGKFDAPTLSEIGDYEDVEVPVWRGVVASPEMDDAAVAFYSEALKKVSETEEWKTEYLDRNMLISNYMDAATATEYMTQFEADYLASLEAAE